MKAIICKYCNKPIENQDQLVSATKFFRIRCFHYVCFQQLEQEVKTPWGFWTPLNGTTGNTRFFIMLLITVWFFVTDYLNGIGDLIGAIALYSLIVRGTAYVLYERRLPKK